MNENIMKLLAMLYERGQFRTANENALIEYLTEELLRQARSK